MLNVIWCLIIAASVVFSVINGTAQELTAGIFEGLEKAVGLLFTMLGIMCFWNGIMSVASASGAVGTISRILRPAIRVLFPSLPRDSDASHFISMNMTANLLGLGNAATPFGLKAMKELSRLNGDGPVASADMMVFVVINTASIQLIPTGIAALRAKYGSAAPMEVLPYILITSAAALITAIVLMKSFNRGRQV